MHRKVNGKWEDLVIYYVRIAGARSAEQSGIRGVKSF